MELEPGNDNERSFEQIAWGKLARCQPREKNDTRANGALPYVGGDAMTRIQMFSVIHVIQE